MRMKLPDHFEVYVDDKPVLVRFGYDPGEAQWFDARAGVGSPGYDPSVCVTEVNFGGAWELPDVYPQLNLAAIEQEISERIIAIEEEEMAARDEAEYNAWNERV